MTSDQLLDALRAKGLLTDQAVTKAKRDIILSGKSAEAVLYADRLADDVAVAKLKSELLKVPYVKLPTERDASLRDLIPEETVRTYLVAPISRKENMLVIGMVNPDDERAQEALKFIARQARLNLGVFLIAYSDWQSTLRDYSPYKSEIAEAVQSLQLRSDEADAERVVELEANTGRSEDAPVIRIVADTLREAVGQGASDIHFEPLEHALRVRFRIDGDLREVATLPRELADSVISRIKVLSSMKIDERRVPQDGRFRSRILDRQVDFRVATFPTPLGEKVAIRVLDPTSGIKNFEQLGLQGRNLEIIHAGLDKPFGMVLVTGPTGSGKTTTLYAVLQLLNKEDVNIVSLEDPVEYFVPGVNQSQVRPEIGYTFAEGLRQILRQDPDVIMVGEIRDRETADLAVQAALTGHIMLSTLHTNNAAGVIPRLVDLGVEPFLLPSALNLMIAQRLVSRVCQNCKEAVEAPPALQQEIKKALESLPPGTDVPYHEPYQIYHGKGCPKCHNRGTVGRLAVFEAYRMTPEMEGIIAKGATSSLIAEAAKRDGSITMRQDGVLKALAGFIPLEEVLKETEQL
jgi:type IV pilus assembly protein PilB